MLLSFSPEALLFAHPRGKEMSCLKKCWLQLVMTNLGVQLKVRCV